MKKLFFILFFLSILIPQQVRAQSDDSQNYPGQIISIKEEKELDIEGHKQLYQKIEIKLENKKNIEVENGNVPVVHSIKYKVGEKVLVMRQVNPDGQEVYFITDFVRTDSLYWLFGLFLILTIAVGRKSGIRSTLGMIFSFAVIFKIILPQILAGNNPILVIALSSLFVAPVSFYLAHGFNKKTHVAIIATLMALLITAFLANYFVNSARLTGYASEEAGFLQAQKQGSFDIKSLLIAGIIIASLGILNDITVSQASVVEQIAKSAPNISFQDLFKNSMIVGQDHIASMVNTLVLVYAGSSLPLLLLFINNPHPPTEILNYEIISEEFVRTFLTSSALIMAVPLTNLLACIAFVRPDNTKTPSASK